MIEIALEPPNLVQVEGHLVLFWNGRPNTSIVCSVVHQLCLTMPSTDCHSWRPMDCLMNSQLSLKQRKQFSIWHQTSSLVQLQYLQWSIKQEVNQWQRNLQSCSSACGGRRLIPQEFKNISIIHIYERKKMFKSVPAIEAQKILATILLNRLTEQRESAKRNESAKSAKPEPRDHHQSRHFQNWLALSATDSLEQRPHQHTWTQTPHT